MEQETILLVHGLWMNGLEMSLLGKRLSRTGFKTLRFKYPSVNSGPPDNANALQEFIQGIDSEKLHFVCHSLGGLVVRHLFHRFPDQRPGRIVTLGTPHRFSQAAKYLAGRETGRRILGHSVKSGLLGNVPAWSGSHELGVIAGRLRFGLGMIIPGIPRPNDGTVAVSETRLDGMTDHIVLPVSHFGLLISAAAADQTLRFLQTGHFTHNAMRK
ncbi:MAG TPA: alpha/beta fold hydrolase [Gammaproteobacteria bacterium]|nr:alpha/beta fold hydrolase [Gammaproteobacteria bacterium]